MCNHHECIAELLKHEGIDVNSLDKSQYTALHYCAQYNCAKCAEVLIQNGNDIDVNIPNSVGSTPLHIAALQNSIETLVVLLTAPGINVNALDRLKRTPLMCAIRGEYIEMVKVILSAKGVNLFVTDENGVCLCFINHRLTTRGNQNRKKLNSCFCKIKSC